MLALALVVIMTYHTNTKSQCVIVYSNAYNVVKHCEVAIEDESMSVKDKEKIWREGVRQ